MNLDRSLTRARRIEEEIRGRALLPVNLEINGIEVRQFNLEHWLILLKIRSPFLVAGKNPDEGDIGTFLWVVSPEYDPRSFGSDRRLVERIRRYLATRRRQVFLKRVVTQRNWINFTPRIRKYLERAFMDRPATSDRGKQIAAGLGASFIYRIANAVNCTRQEVREMPLNEAFQYMNWTASNLPQFNPKQTATINRFYAWQDRQTLNLNGAEAHG